MTFLSTVVNLSHNSSKLVAECPLRQSACVSLWTLQANSAKPFAPKTRTAPEIPRTEMSAMYARRWTLIALVVAMSPLAALADDGWSMPNLNPFARKGAPPTSARVSDSTGWKMPSLWPKSKPAATSSRRTAQPSAWQKMTNSTKKFWATTADTLNPFNDANDKPPQPISATGSNSYFSQVANRKPSKPKSNSFLPSWRMGEAEPEVRETNGDVNKFLSQPRPGF
jgi:hypothetical protein